MDIQAAIDNQVGPVWFSKISIHQGWHGPDPVGVFQDRFHILEGDTVPASRLGYIEPEEVCYAAGAAKSRLTSGLRSESMSISNRWRSSEGRRDTFPAARSGLSPFSTLRQSSSV